MTQSTATTATNESPLSALRRKWWLALILCPLGAALGATAASIGPTKYTAETMMSVGKGGLSAQAVPGFALGRQQLAEDYSRWVNNTTADVGDDKVEIISTNVPESAQVKILGTSSDKAAAIKAVNAKAADLKKQINSARPDNDPTTVLKRYESAAVASAKMESQVDEAFSRYQSAIGGRRSTSTIASLKTKLDDLRSQQALLDIRKETLGERYKTLMADNTTATDLTTVRDTRITGNDRVAKLQRYGLVGFVLGGLLSLLLATMLGRKGNGRPVRSQAGAAPVRRPAPAGNRRPVQGQSQSDATTAPRNQQNRVASGATTDPRRTGQAASTRVQDGNRRS